MSENYFYSSLTGQEIEDTLLGAVVFNSDQELTTSQKARARQNIGAGEGSTSFKILGFFATLSDLQEYLQIVPTPGDAYGISVNPTSDGELFSPDGMQTQFALSTDDPPWHITVTESGTVLEPTVDYIYANGVITFATAPAAGTDTISVAWYDKTAPYNVFVWDGVTQSWIDNGALLSSSLIDDNDTLTTKTWSSQKISTELSGKQDTLGAGDISTNMLASQAVTRQKLANDALYSPLRDITVQSYSVGVDDIGKTICPNYSALHGSPCTITLPQSVSTQFPIGTEIAIFWQHSSSLTLAFSGGTKSVNAGGEDFSANAQYSVLEKYSIVGLKKTGSSANGDYWIIQGNVEVVT